MKNILLVLFALAGATLAFPRPADA